MNPKLLLKTLPHLKEAVDAFAKGDMRGGFIHLLTGVVQFALISGLVVLAGCGSISYDSTGKTPVPIVSKSDNREVIKEVEVRPGN